MQEASDAIGVTLKNTRLSGKDEHLSYKDHVILGKIVQGLIQK